MAETDPPQTGTEPPPQPVLLSVAEYALVMIGLALLFLGWYGISGKANVGEQLPILASASLPGVGLVVAGAVLIASDRTRRSNERAAAMVEALFQLLTEAAGPAAEASTSAGSASPSAKVADRSGFRPGELVAIAGGTRFHRPECALVDAKRGVGTVDATAIGERNLEPCPICDPPVPVSIMKD